jgi:hypothetical protein
LLRTAASPPELAPPYGLKGMQVMLRSAETGELFRNTGGLWGFPAQLDYALWLPPGRYELASVFVYNGSVAPKMEPFSVVVAAGEVVNIGTIATDWHFPKDYSRGDVAGLKIYARPDCNVFGCVESRAEVYVLRDTVDFTDTLRKAGADMSRPVIDRLLQ